jgi:L-lysine exporter family protein LysE/ArgO
VNAFLAGLSTGLSLIVAIGAQNTYVLRLGLARHRVGLAVAICIAADLILIAAGTAGVGVVVRSAPEALVIFKWLGVAYIALFAFRSFAAARHPGHLDAVAEDAPSMRAVVLATMGFTFLNPHVYLDTVLLLGSLSAQFGHAKWLFALGAGTGSVLWFCGLGLGARAAAPVMARESLWRLLDVLIGCVMVAVAVSIAMTHVAL